LRITKTKAIKLREGDQIVVTVSRVMGMQGRKPKSGAPLMRVEYEDGTFEVLREDQDVRVVRG
jgi:hypothetical protein